MAKSRARKLADLIVAAGVDIDGNLTFDGGSTSADLTFADNDKANFGDASDLQIYHDGSSNLIQGSNGSLYIQAKAGENSILATPDGGVNIYHDNSLKFETTAAGATLTGALTATSTSNALIARYDDNNYSTLRYDGVDTAAGGDGVYKRGGSEKLRLTTSGITVTGTITSGAITSSGNIVNDIGNSGNDSFIELKNTGYTGNVTSLRQNADSTRSELNSTERPIFIQAGSAGDSSNAEIRLYANQQLGYKLDANKLSTFYGNITSSGTLTAAGGELYLGAADTASGHINSYEVMTFNIDSDNDDTNRHFTWYTNGNSGSGTLLMRLTEAGYLGIGETLPDGPLHVKSTGHGSIFEGTTGDVGIVLHRSDGSAAVDYGYLQFKNSTAVAGQIVVRGEGSASGKMQFFTRDTSGTFAERMVIRHNGNVGIGTTSPVGTLDVSSTNAVGSVFRKDFNGPVEDTFSKVAVTLWGQDHDDADLGTGTDQYGPMLGFGARVDDSDPNSGDIRAGISYSYNGDMTFHAKAGASVADGSYERIRIDGATGNVGIGTTSPATKFHVSAGTTNANIIARLEQGTTAGNYSAIEVGRTDGSGNVQLTPAVTGGVPIAGIPGILLGSTNTALPAVAIQTPNSSSGHIVFNPKGTEKVRITADGNVGIGTTSPDYALDVLSSNGPTTARFANNDGEDTLVRIIAGNYNTELDARLFIGEADSYGMTFEYDGVANIGYLGMNDNVDPTGAFSKRIQMSRGGTEVAFMAGNVGIGTTSPAVELDIKRTANAYPLRIGSSQGEGRAIVFADVSSSPNKYNWIAGTQYNIDNGFEITRSTAVGGYTFSTPLLVIRDTGRVGIGTSSPSYKLDVSGPAQFKDGSSAALFQEYGSGMTLWLDGSDGDFLGGDYFGIHAYGTTSLDFSYGATSKVSILSNGKVGIGTGSPNVKLEVQGSSASTYSGSGPGATIIASQGTDGNWIASNVNGKFAYFGIDGNDAKFAAYNYATNTEMGMVLGQSRMYIKNNGQVGIGETNPNQDAAVEIAKAAPNTGVTTLRLTNSVNNKGQRIDFEDDNAARAFTLSHDNGSNITYMGNLVNEPFAFYTNNTERMRITSSGIVKGSDSEFLGFEDAINILNADPEDGGSDFDQTPTNLSDGGGTTWEISNDGDAIYFSSTSGGHGGTWMHVYCDAGLWAIKGSVRLTNTDGAIHPNTSSDNYKFTHSFRFYIDSGPDSGTLKWDADAAASTTGTDFTRAAFSGTPVYMSGGYKTIKYQTNGYNGVQRIYITDLQLVKVG